MGNYPRFFGKDASNLPADPIKETTLEIKRIRDELAQVETDMRFLLMWLREGYRER
jgi:hypothetical protein